MDTKCVVCGRTFTTYPSRIARGEDKCCSHSCANRIRGRAGSSNPNWKGGRFKHSDGYIAVGVGNSQYRLEHDVVIEGAIGRPLRKDENVHHKNGVRDDNRLGNLELCTISEHIREYHPSLRQPECWVTTRCLFCDREFERRRPQSVAHPHTFCSRDCYFQGRRDGLTA